MKTRFLIAILLCFIFSGCNPENEDVSDNYSLPIELKDYKVVRLDSSLGNYLYVIVKKQGEDRKVIGTEKGGKNHHPVIVIDGEEYVKKTELENKD